MIASLILGIFTFVQLNCENFFDCEHDSLKEDTEYSESSLRHWNKSRYWRKLRNISKEIIACSAMGDAGLPVVPDLVALCEIENDSVAHYLTKRSPLRNARYEYVITSSPDVRGIDVALLYSPMSFRLISSRPLRVPPLRGMRPTRDILYAEGEMISGDTLHVFVVHSPSRYAGKRATMPFRMAVAERLTQSVDSIRALHPDAKIIISGDFNDETRDKPLQHIISRQLTDISYGAMGSNGAKGTYKYQGLWQSIDHILVSNSMKSRLLSCRIFDMPFLLEDDERYGGKKPRRTYEGYKYRGGYSDHLPLVACFRFEDD